MLRKYSVAGIVTEILDLKYLYVESHINAYYNPSLASNSDAVKAVVLNNITTYSNSSEMNKYGAKFKYSKFQAVVDNSNDSITSNITKIEIRRNLRPLLNQNAEYELCFGNAFYIKNNNGYNIKTSGFNIFGVADTVYLSDAPNEDGTTGTLFLFTLASRNNPTIISNNVGSIDYQKGEVLIKPINIINTSKKVQNIPIVEVSACPKSNDVIGLQDLYLQLDVSNSTIDMVSDNITSGDNTAGTLYTATSSYIVGDIARLTEAEKANTSLLSSDTYVVGSSNMPQAAPQY
tara:strand:- start:37 stop:906 length:870 start_codon:yes stop_codon:yes gene_type:complete